MAHLGRTLAFVTQARVARSSAPADRVLSTTQRHNCEADHETAQTCQYRMNTNVSSDRANLHANMLKPIPDPSSDFPIKLAFHRSRVRESDHSDDKFIIKGDNTRFNQDSAQL